MSRSACETCGTTDGVTRYGTGLRCVSHSPAGLAGRAIPTPDPTRTAEGLRDRPNPERAPWPYGVSTSDPLGRTKRNRNTGLPMHEER